MEPASATVTALQTKKNPDALPRLKSETRPQIDRQVALLKLGSIGGVKPGQLRRFGMGVSALLFVVLPIILSVLYFGLIASDRYNATAHFTVRSQSSVPSTDLLTSITGVADSGSTTTDSYIILDYLESRELVEALQESLDIRALFSRPEADFLTRLDPEVPIEDLIDYWLGRIDTSFDAATNIITFEVDAFRAEDAKRIADEVVLKTGQLVNRLSEQARQDTVKYAREEVTRAELRVRALRQSTLKFREDNNEIDPTKNAEGQLTIISGLEAQLATIRIQIAALRNEVSDDSPTIKNLRREELALENQLARQKEQLSLPRSVQTNQTETTGDEKRFQALTSLLSNYEELLLDREFAEKMYAATLASLERARADADRNQRYLAVFVNPSVAELAAYPRRLLSVAIISILSIVFWGVGVVIFYSIRDHLA